MSSNRARRIFQMDHLMDSLSKRRSEIKSLQTLDIGYGRLESRRALKDFNFLGSLMVGTIESNRVNLRIIFI